MLFSIAVFLLVAWLLGFLGFYTIGSFVHVLLVAAIVLFLVGMLGGRPRSPLSARRSISIGMRPIAHSRFTRRLRGYSG